MVFNKVDHLTTNLTELAKFVKHEKKPSSATAPADYHWNSMSFGFIRTFVL